MEPKIFKNLFESFGNLSKMSSRSSTYALRAKKDNREDLSLLFKVLSDSESVQAKRMLRLMHDKVGDTDENLRTAFEEEIPSLLERYGKAADNAKDESDVAVTHAFSQSKKVSSKNVNFYSKVKNGHLNARKYFVCQFCGYVHENEAPIECPICQAPKKRFKQIE